MQTHACAYVYIRVPTVICFLEKKKKGGKGRQRWQERRTEGRKGRPSEKGGGR